jgi:hypothetical protein
MKIWVKTAIIGGIIGIFLRNITLFLNSIFCKQTNLGEYATDLPKFEPCVSSKFGFVNWVPEYPLIFIWTIIFIMIFAAVGVLYEKWKRRK